MSKMHSNPQFANLVMREASILIHFILLSPSFEISFIVVYTMSAYTDPYSSLLASTYSLTPSHSPFTPPPPFPHQALISICPNK